MQYICTTSEIPEGESRGFEHNGTAFFIVHHHGQFHAYINSCPHRGIELNWVENQFLDIEGQLIQCATHGALFLINNGKCVAGPCQGQSLRPLMIKIINEQLWLAEQSY
jgi:nitrite reductase/ring-hydroxylating ferredoxin subunit